MLKRKLVAAAAVSVLMALAVTGCQNSAGGGEEPTRFMMGSEAGSDGDKPVHQVTLTKKIWISDHEVTQKEWNDVMGDLETRTNKPTDNYGKGDNFPMYYVSWYDALVYCNKLSMKEGLTPCYTLNGKRNPDEWGAVPISSDPTWNAVTCDWNANGYRLPTEAEWEYAARGGDNTTDVLIYAGTKAEGDLKNYAWYSANSQRKTHAVKSISPNAYGLYDMSGNVWEWCWDWYAAYTAESVTDPRGPTSGSSRVNRGGCWDDVAAGCAVSYRVDFAPNDLGRDLGFRVVCGQ